MACSDDSSTLSPDLSPPWAWVGLGWAQGTRLLDTKTTAVPSIIVVTRRSPKEPWLGRANPYLEPPSFSFALFEVALTPSDLLSCHGYEEHSSLAWLHLGNGKGDTLFAPSP